MVAIGRVLLLPLLVEFTTTDTMSRRLQVHCQVGNRAAGERTCRRKVVGGSKQ